MVIWGDFAPRMGVILGDLGVSRVQFSFLTQHVGSCLHMNIYGI